MSISEARTEELKARLKERDEHLRESWVRTMEARIVRDKLTKCHRLEGVNSTEKCKDIAERYAQMIEQNRVHGYKKIDV